MRMDVSNCIEKEKLKYNDIHDLVLAEDVRRKDSDELLGLGSTLNVNNQGRGNRVDQNPELELRVSHTQDKRCVGIVKNLGTSRKIAEIQRKNGIIL